MTPEEHARLDDATVRMCRRTSWQSVRDFLRDCAFCGAPFWCHIGNERFCSDRHRVAHWRAAHLEAARAADRAEYRRRRDARRVA